MSIWILVSFTQPHEPGYDIIDVFTDEALAQSHLEAYKHNTGFTDADLIEYEINNNPPQRV